MNQIGLSIFIQTLLQSDRYKDPRRLTKYGWKVYSQNDEDGILQEIFCRIGTTSRNFVEFGVETGIQCNSMWLLLQGWTGLWIEANAESCARIRETHHAWIQSGSLALGGLFRSFRFVYM